MIVRLSVLATGLVALLVGGVGLFSPISVSPGLAPVPCGSAVAPDYATAREQAPADTQTSPNELPYDTEWAGDVDYAQLCRDEVEDRRLWTIPLAAVGALTLVGAAVMSVRARHSSATT